jgi:hypothetical protein
MQLEQSSIRTRFFGYKKSLSETELEQQETSTRSGGGPTKRSGRMKLPLWNGW